MSPTLCPKLFGAEAMRDGRLAEAERASFRRHVTVCAACAREVQALDGLSQALRAATPNEAHADELHVWRERTRLFAAFDRALVAQEGRWGGGGRRWLWPMAVATLVVAVVLVLGRGRLSVNVVPLARAVIRADGGAVWSQRREGKGEKVTLQRGTLGIHVDHAAGEGRFVVVLPDGELEDQGTTFTVSVEDGQTKRVTVEEGRVVLRIRGLPSVAIGPGDTWIPDTAPAAVPRPGSAPRRELSPRAQLPPRARTASPPRLPVPATSALRDPSVDFRAAMAALRIGDNHEAAAALTGFLARYPRDPRAEEAAYVRVIALQRCGANSDMKWAAQEYLRRYPAGFRRAEVERLASRP